LRLGFFSKKEEKHTNSFYLQEKSSYNKQQTTRRRIRWNRQIGQRSSIEKFWHLRLVLFVIVFLDISFLLELFKTNFVEGSPNEIQALNKWTVAQS
jgi:hypothetical protein